jgi:hypothetical protein
MNRLETVAFALVLVASASPAFAAIVETPAPVAGVGIGAALLIGAGYRAVKARIK